MKISFIAKLFFIVCTFYSSFIPIRGVSVGSWIGGTLGGVGIATSVWPRGCSQKYGCHRGYCWAGCAGAFPTVNGPEWCYTSFRGHYKMCSSDMDCDPCAQCQGACSL